MNLASYGTEIDSTDMTPSTEVIMPDRDRSSERNDSRSENEVSSSSDSARDTRFQADDRGGSRDGERLEPGEAGDREQLDNDGGRESSRR
jgi:hypothetical protein